MKRKAPPSPPRLPKEQALTAYCHECFSMPGETCRNYLGHAKAPCRQRGYTAPPAAAKPRGLFDIQPEAPAQPEQAPGYPHDSGEGPFNTWAEALDFAEAECGAAYQVTQAPDGRWRIMLRDPAPTLGILVERDDMMEGTVFHWSLIDLGTGSPVESSTVPCADEAQAYTQARARAAELGRTIDNDQCMTEDMTI